MNWNNQTAHTATDKLKNLRETLKLGYFEKIKQREHA